MLRMVCGDLLEFATEAGWDRCAVFHPRNGTVVNDVVPTVTTVILCVALFGILSHLLFVVVGIASESYPY